MKKMIGFVTRPLRNGLVITLALGLTVSSCQRATPPATDSTSLQQHGEVLKKQHEREMKNK
jgi:hypothetical protein